MEKYKISICIPTLGRPEKLKRLLDSIKENAGYENYEVLVEEDKPLPNNEGAPKVLKRLVEKSTGDWVCFLGNDCVALPDLLKEAANKMLETFPEADGLVALNDGIFLDGHIATHWVASKRLLPCLDGEFFCTQYFHTGVDKELSLRCQKMGKYVWAEKAKIIHDHPCTRGGRDSDAVYDSVYSGPKWVHDDKLFRERVKLLNLDIKL